MISLAVAAPKVVKSLQRDRDLETFHRGMQYRRAIQLYYRKFHAYPPNVDALVDTNDIRFLRKKYTDPVTSKQDWQPVLFGQNKTPTAMGFFGQPLSGSASSIAGIGPGGGNGMPGATNPAGGAFGGGSGSLFGSGSSSNNSIFGSNSSSNTSSSATTSSGSSGSSTDNSGGTGTTGASGGTGSSSNSTTSSGQTFGGAGIIGFSPASDKQSIVVYKKKNHYNEWEFTYDPLSDMQTMGGGNMGAIGQPASNTTNPVGSSPFSGSTFGNSGNGSSTGFGNNPPPVSSPPTSTQ
jgi:hypothetical protein